MYLAECVSKSDEYARDDNGGTSPGWLRRGLKLAFYAAVTHNEDKCVVYTIEGELDKPVLFQVCPGFKLWCLEGAELQFGAHVQNLAGGDAETP